MPSDNCPKCLKPKQDQIAGSITQWLSFCRCAPLDQQAKETTEPHQKVRCGGCGKSISQEKPGSLTQWIFKEDACSCSRPQPIEPATDSFKQPPFIGFEESDDESVLDLAEEKFPLERYKPISLLGHGESGAVYLSRDRLLGKKVAVKVIRKVEREALLSFQNEAKTTSKLNHPNIIRVLDFGSTSGGTPYMVMDYVQGSTLEAYLKVNETLDLQKCVAIFADIADALAYAHEADVLHRDIKPSNIMVYQTDGILHASVIDFGVAKMQEHFEDTTQVNGTTLVGTPAYMSPDQALGREFDHRSDIYSLGCVFFECLTGRPPYVADSALEVISLHAHQEIPSLAELYPISSTIEFLDEMIRNCLDKDPNRRYNSAAEFRAALQEIPVLKRWRSSPPSGIHPVPGSKARKTSPLAPMILVSSCILISSFASIAWYMLSGVDASSESNTNNFGQSAIISLENGHLEVTSGNDSDLEQLRHQSAPIESAHFIDSHITAAGIKCIQKKKIRSLSIYTKSGINDSLLTGIAKLKYLRRLHLASSQTINPKTLCLIANLPELEDLFLRDLQLSKETFRAIGKMTHLQNLKLQDCSGIDRQALQELKSIGSLNSIEISMGQISPSILDGLSDLPQLKSLDLSGTDVKDDDLDRLLKCSSLQHLSLQFCPNITSAAAEAFSKRAKVDVFSNSEQTTKFWKDTDAMEP